MLAASSLPRASLFACRHIAKLIKNAQFQPVFKNPLISHRLVATAPPKLDNSIPVIYEGPLGKQIRLVKFFSLSTSALGIMSQPILIKAAGPLGTAGTIITSIVVGFFTIIMPLLLHWVTRKYVLTLRYDEAKNEYTAETISLFLRKIYTTFKIEDCRVPDIDGMFTSIYIKEKPMFLDQRFFTEPDHFIKIMGYDKPIDFKLGNVTAKESSKKDL